MDRRTLTAAGIAVILAGIAVVVFATLRDDRTTEQDTVLTDLTGIAESPATAPEAPIDPPSPDAEADFPAIVDSAVKDPEQRTEPVAASYEILEVIPHDTSAFTQGLEISNGRLFESTGLVGRSSIRELDIDTGEVLRSTAVDDVFAEGLTVLDDTALQLTWQDGVAYRYDTETFERIATYTYEGEGWGLCHDDDQLVMSNGTPTLQFRDPDTFALVSTIEVTYAGAPVDQLNELECVGGTVWANIWKSLLIIEISPTTGQVLTVLNAATLAPPEVANDASAVLNGIAYDPADDTFLLTGKLWPSMFRVQITTPE